jgi:hypothetical protein
MEVIVNFMEADPSFAGVGAYYSNIPMKTFMGSEPLLPVAVAAEALDVLQFGGATAQHKMDMKHKLQPDACASTCLANVQKGCASLMMHKAGGAADMESAQCMMEGKNLCSSICASVGGGGSMHQGKGKGAKGMGKGGM